MKANDCKDFLILGILNLTPDSFSDGGQYQTPEQAVTRFQQLLADGADLVDIGAESTRPGADPVTPDAEWQRLYGLFKALAFEGLLDRVSLDSRHAETAVRALNAGVSCFNNVEGLFSTEVLRRLHRGGAKRYIAMHMHGTPKDMQRSPISVGAVDAVYRAFQQYRHALLEAGWAPEQIYMDPGIGFGKDDIGNLHLLAHTSSFAREFQVALGVSRKGFIGRLLELENPESRDGPSKMLEMGLVMAGAKIIRTHSVKQLKIIKKTLRGE